MTVRCTSEWNKDLYWIFYAFFFIQFSIPSSINRKNYYSRYLIILVSKFLYSRLLRLFFKVSLRAKGREKNLDSRLESSSIPPFQFASSNKLATSFRIKADYASWLCSSNAKKGWRKVFIRGQASISIKCLEFAVFHYNSYPQLLSLSLSLLTRHATSLASSKKKGWNLQQAASNGPINYSVGLSHDVFVRECSVE